MQQILKYPVGQNIEELKEQFGDEDIEVALLIAQLTKVSKKNAPEKKYYRNKPSRFIWND